MPRISSPPSNQNLSAFLDTIAHSEIGDSLLKVSDDGYNIIVGSTANHPILFDNYSDHPNRLIHLSATLSSTAAGRYQILYRYWKVYKVQLGLPDFSPVSQDHVAIQLIRECKALDLIQQGYISQALVACNSRWASLPGSAYGQHVNQTSDLLRAFVNAGGTTSE